MRRLQLEYPPEHLYPVHEWQIVEAHEQAFGLARTGQTIVDIPDATVLQLFVDDEPTDR